MVVSAGRPGRPANPPTNPPKVVGEGLDPPPCLDSAKLNQTVILIDLNLNLMKSLTGVMERRFSKGWHEVVRFVNGFNDGRLLFLAFGGRCGSQAYANELNE
jgi:hypothetical protein